MIRIRDICASTSWSKKTSKGLRIHYLCSSPRLSRKISRFSRNRFCRKRRIIRISLTQSRRTSKLRPPSEAKDPMSQLARRIVPDDFSKLLRVVLINRQQSRISKMNFYKIRRSALIPRIKARNLIQKQISRQNPAKNWRRRNMSHRS